MCARLLHLFFLRTRERERTFEIPVTWPSGTHVRTNFQVTENCLIARSKCIWFIYGMVCF